MFVTVTGEILNAGDGKRAWIVMAMAAVCGSNLSPYITSFCRDSLWCQRVCGRVSSTHH